MIPPLTVHTSRSLIHAELLTASECTILFYKIQQSLLSDTFNAGATNATKGKFENTDWILVQSVSPNEQVNRVGES